MLLRWCLCDSVIWPCSPSGWLWPRPTIEKAVARSNARRTYAGRLWLERQLPVSRDCPRHSLEHFGTCLLLGESVPANANAADAPTADAAAVAATAIGANANATNGAGAKGFQALPCSFRSSLRTITVRCRIGKPCLDLCLLSLSTWEKLVHILNKHETGRNILFCWELFHHQRRLRSRLSLMLLWGGYIMHPIASI